MADEVELVNFETGESLPLWHDYTFQSDFLTPTDAFSFTTGGRAFEMRDLARKLLPGTRVSLIIGGRAQATGFVVATPLRAMRAGSLLAVKGYDALWPMVNGCIDPDYVLTEGTTLQDLIVTVGTSFGFNKFSTTDIARRSVVTGNLAANTATKTINQKITVAEYDVGGTKYSKESVVPIHTERYDPTRPKFLSNLTLKQVQPHPGNGAFQFVAKLLRRFELWMWVNELGDELIVSDADFDQEPSYELFNDGRGRVNYDSGEIVADGTHQPSVIIATGYGAGATFRKSKLKVAMINELTGLDESGRPLRGVASAIFGAFGCKVLDLRPELVAAAIGFRNSVSRPLYLHDNESKTIGQLEAFVRHEMATRQSKAATLRYTVRDHTQSGRPWAVNTIVQVDDDVLDVHDRMWVKSRKFGKSRESPGTISVVDLIRRHTLDLGSG